MRGSADFHSAVAACLGLNIARRLHICEGPGLSRWSIQWQNPVLFSTARTRAEVATHSLISKGAINDQLMISLLLELVLPLKLADWNWLRCSTHILCLEKWNAATLPPPPFFFLLPHSSFSLHSIRSCDWSSNAQYCFLLKGCKQVGPPAINTCLQKFKINCGKFFCQ